MSNKNRTKTLYAALIAVVVVLAGVLAALSRNQVALNSSQEVRLQSHLLASELRQSSEDLTRFARTYVVTGDARYERMYWDVLAVRKGEKPRPDGRQVALRSLMEQLGFTEAEFGKLREAEDKSNGLVRTETIAMNAMKGQFDDGAGQFTRTGAPDPELARRLMHNDAYHANVAIIMQPIAAFDKMLDTRTKAAVDGHISQGNLLLIAVGILLAAAAVFGWLIARNINTVLTAAIANLNDATRQVATASGEVSSSTNTVAQGTSRQAAALEETSASAEEIQTMIVRNAEHSQKASEHMKQVRVHVQDGDQALRELVLSMDHIIRSSHEIGKIIRVMDEIAFQTNILALNAAVEAARAGDAGLGFAVVADEVRILAQRAKDAARSIGGMIEESISRTSDGNSRLQDVAGLFRQITEGTEKVTALVDDVSTASDEQSRGIQQVARAIAEMESVTQSTAATAEQAAAATEQISAQSRNLLDVVTGLQTLVAGAGRR